MAALRDNEALLTIGQILAGFLKEYLPSEDRWTRFVAPALANSSSPPNVEVALDQLDLSALLQVFLGNREYFRSGNVFRTTLPFNCAFCVRNMRNSRAHQSHANAISDDERLFDLNVLRRFTLFIDNRATEPGLIDEFLSALDATIIDISKRCFGDGLVADRTADASVDLAAHTAAPDNSTELISLIGDVLSLIRDNFDRLSGQLGSVESLVSQNRSFSLRTQEGVGNELRAGSAGSDASPPIIDQLNAIDAKIDRLLGTAADKRVEVEAEAPTVESYQETELLSGLEAKAALRSLRAQFAIEFPNTDPTHALLRQSMVDIFLANRIDNVTKYEAIVPEIMKRDTDATQKPFLPKVFDVVKRLR